MPAPPGVIQQILRIAAFRFGATPRLDHGGQEVRISAMGDSEKDQVFSPPTNQSENRAWVPMAAGGVFVLVLLVGLVLLTRAGKPANTSPAILTWPSSRFPGCIWPRQKTLPADR